MNAAALPDWQANREPQIGDTPEGRAWCRWFCEQPTPVLEAMEAACDRAVAAHRRGLDHDTAFARALPQLEADFDRIRREQPWVTNWYAEHGADWRARRPAF